VFLRVHHFFSCTLFSVSGAVLILAGAAGRRPFLFLFFTSFAAALVAFFWGQCHFCGVLMSPKW
jgi:hypothetical protein